jgi:molybdenum cofactor cytidylyltransferase
MKTGAILLAAGFSRRFGDVKLKAVLPNGNSVLQQSLHNLSKGISDIILVSRQELIEYGILKAIPSDDIPYQLVLCSDAQGGMGHTLACGVRALPADWDACLICLGDMPFVSPATFKQLVSAATPDNILIPSYQGQCGHPVCFGRGFFPSLASSRGDTGARDLIKQHKNRVIELALDDPGILKDIDTPEDLAAC